MTGQPLNEPLGITVQIHFCSLQAFSHLCLLAQCCQSTEEQTWAHTVLMISFIMYSSLTKTKSTGSLTLSDFNSADENQRCASPCVTSYLNASTVDRLSNTSKWPDLMSNACQFHPHSQIEHSLNLEMYEMTVVTTTRNNALQINFHTQ